MYDSQNELAATEKHKREKQKLEQRRCLGGTPVKFFWWKLREPKYAKTKLMVILDLRNTTT